LAITGCAPAAFSDIGTFEECIEAGYPILESYPPQCHTPDGKTFSQVIEFGWIACTRDDVLAEVCSTDYMPICGENGITYGNRCSGCSSGELDYYKLGECDEDIQKSYISDDPDECSLLGIWPCDADMELFSDEYGCGCRSIEGGVIGADLDEDGCHASAGYTLDKEVGACIRQWELDAAERDAAKLAVSINSYYPLTIDDVVSADCENCYAVKIIRGDTESISVVMIENRSIGQGGILDATVDIGPLCGAQQSGKACEPTAATYQSWPLEIYDAQHNYIKGLVADEYGLLETVLKPGNYSIRLKTDGKMGSTNLPIDFEIVQGGITYLTITIDTGIR
jgi:hypothetical protein